MKLQIYEQEPLYAVNQDYVKTYMAFRENIPKPSDEDKHLRHIFRFYIARALFQHGEHTIYVLPHVSVGTKSFRIDVLTGSPNKYYAALCEPESITPATEEILNVLKDCDNVEVFIVHSQFSDPTALTSRFQSQLQNKKFRLIAVVPPPFDDAYEYDIWMFELTFREQFSGE